MRYFAAPRLRKCFSAPALLLLTVTPGWAIDGFSPPAVTATAPTFQLTILGSGFVAGKSFQWRSPGSLTPVELTAVFVNSGSYRATIPAALLLTAGMAQITEIGTDGSAGASLNYPINLPPHITLDPSLPEHTLPAGTQGAPYLFQNTFRDGTPPMVWSIIGALPPGLALNAQTGLISGTPTTAGTFVIDLKLTDSFGVFHAEDGTLTIRAGGPLTISTASPLPNAKLGLIYSQTLLANGGIPPFNWALAGGTLPPGLTLNASGGALSGTPTAPGAFQFTARVTDSVSGTATKVFALTVDIPTLSCTFSPQNAFIGMHRPNWHGVSSRNADHLVSVDVTADGTPARSVQVAITASQAALQVAPSQIVTTATATTGDSGRATFVINPPAPGAFDQTNFEATGSLGGRTFRCAGSVVTGTGAVGQLFQEATGAIKPSSVLANVAQALVGPLLNFGKIFEQAAGKSPAAGPPADPRPLPPLRPETADQIRPVLAHLRAGLMRGSQPDPAAAAQALQRFANLPLRFERNSGQFGRQVMFMSRAEGYSVALTPSEIRLSTNSKAGLHPTVRIHFAGANRTPHLVPGRELPSVSNYLSGSERRKWRMNVRHYADVVYQQAYSGVDVALHGRNRNLEMDFVVAPGADPKAIVLQFEGTSRVEKDHRTGDLVLRTTRDSIHLERPFVYQEVSGVRRPTRGEYVIIGTNRVAFEVGAYDVEKALVIDPVISFGDVIGGGGIEAAAAIAVDAQGNTYITGGTTSADFPAVGGVQRFGSLGPIPDVFVTKLDPTGTKILYSTFIGGLGADIGSGIAVDSTGSVYVTGITTSPNFPMKNPFQGSLRNTGTSLSDAFVFKLSPSGSDLVYSTYLGGSLNEIAKGITVDASGSAIAVGSTLSLDFPVRNAFQPDYRGAGPNATNAFVVKLNPSGSDLTFSTYVGGTGQDNANGVAVDPSGNTYIVGGTTSPAFPTAAPFQANIRGAQDAFLTKVSPSGSLLFSTYLGGESDDMAVAVAVDSSGSAYMTGLTGSTNFPLVRPAQPKYGSPDSVGFDAFVTKFSPDGASLVYSTYLGGGGIDMAMGIAVGQDRSAYIAGETSSSDFPAVGALQPSSGGSTHAFVSRLDPGGGALIYSTTLAGTGPDSAQGIAVHPSGVYVAGTTTSPNFPATYGAVQAGLRGRADATIVKLIDGTPAPVFTSLHGATLQSATSAAPEAIVAGFGVNLATITASTPTNNLSTTLANVRISVKDSAGADRAAPLFFVSPTHVTYVVPAGSAPGLAAVTVSNSIQIVANGTLRIEAVAPGIFTANADGSGVALAVALRIAPNGAQALGPVFTCGTAPGSCAPSPIDLGTIADRTYILLFGTGFRGRSSLTGVTATIGAQAIPVVSAGPQGEVPGVDQVYIGPLPRNLGGQGTLDIRLTVDALDANPVKISVK